MDRVDPLSVYEHDSTQTQTVFNIPLDGLRCDMQAVWDDMIVTVCMVLHVDFIPSCTTDMITYRIQNMTRCRIHCACYIVHVKWDMWACSRYLCSGCFLARFTQQPQCSFYLLPFLLYFLFVVLCLYFFVLSRMSLPFLFLPCL